VESGSGVPGTRLVGRAGREKHSDRILSPAKSDQYELLLSAVINRRVEFSEWTKCFVKDVVRWPAAKRCGKGEATHGWGMMTKANKVAENSGLGGACGAVYGPFALGDTAIAFIPSLAETFRKSQRRHGQKFHI